jgi:hypothetical protein
MIIAKGMRPELKKVGNNPDQETTTLPGLTNI